MRRNFSRRRLIALQLEHLELARHLVGAQAGKGGKARVVPLGEEAEAWLQAYLLRVRPQLVRNPALTHVFVDPGRLSRHGPAPPGQPPYDGALRDHPRRAGASVHGEPAAGPRGARTLRAKSIFVGQHPV